MQNQPLFEAPFASEVGNDCSKYVSSQWNSRYHWRFCQGIPCLDSNGRQSICIRPGTGKCMCKRCQGEAPPPLNPKTYATLNHEAQWLFELPHTEEYYNGHPEADAMFGWAKQRWEQWRKRTANRSSVSSSKLDVSTLIRQLDHDSNPGRALTQAEQAALTQVVTHLINRSILKKKQEIQDPRTSPIRIQELRNNLTRLVHLGRFRFLKQLPQLRMRFMQALEGTGVRFPY